MKLWPAPKRLRLHGFASFGTPPKGRRPFQPASAACARGRRRNGRDRLRKAGWVYEHQVRAQRARAAQSALSDPRKAWKRERTSCPSRLCRNPGPRTRSDATSGLGAIESMLLGSSSFSGKGLHAFFRQAGEKSLASVGYFWSACHNPRGHRLVEWQSRGWTTSNEFRAARRDREPGVTFKR